VAIAETLLKEFDQHCVEEKIELDAESFNSATLLEIATSCGVTLQTGKHYLCILGLRDSVQEAVAVVKEHKNHLESFSDPPPPLVNEKPDVEEVNKVTDMPSPPTEALAMNDGKITNKVCPTCGVCPFCSKCGHPVAFFYENDAFGFAKYVMDTNVPGNDASVPVGSIYVNSDYYGQQVIMGNDTSASVGSVYGNQDYYGQQMVWQQMPFVPPDFGMNGGVVDNSGQMAFMVPPPAQNVQVWCVPAPMMPAQCQS
jgi:hypothetical protein